MVARLARKNKLFDMHTVVFDFVLAHFAGSLREI